MVALKTCGRCRGDVHAVGDIYGEYTECLQCGHIVDVVPVKKNVPWVMGTPMGRQKPGRPRKARPRRNAA